MFCCSSCCKSLVNFCVLLYLNFVLNMPSLLSYHTIYDGYSKFCALIFVFCLRIFMMCCQPTSRLRQFTSWICITKCIISIPNCGEGREGGERVGSRRHQTTDTNGEPLHLAPALIIQRGLYTPPGVWVGKVGAA